MLDEFFHLGSFVTMSDSPQKISRQDLYEKIWATPIVKLGKELGYSYLEMVQLCEKLNIPRPDGGYWYRRQHGEAEERATLPAPHPNAPLEIELGPRLKDNPESVAEPVDINRKNATEDIARNQPNSSTTPPEAVKTSESPIVKPIKKREAVEKPVVPKINPEVVESTANEPTLIQFTRRELYDAVWSKTCQKLAADLGISDVGLAKTCKRMGIPRPSLGYWARVAVGEKVPKTPLPDSQAGQDKIVTFDVAANRKKREEWRSTNNDVDSLAVDLALPPEEMELHPVAQRHLRALEKHKPGEDGCVNVNARDLFRCNVTPAIVNRLAALNHPNIVTIYDFGQAGGFYYLLMEFVDGLNLRQLLRTRKFTPEEALAIVPTLCDALQFAHDRGIVHRDIKPENLLLDKTGKVKVADFGIAKMLGMAKDGRVGATAAPETVTQSAVGTPSYSAPEQKTDPQRVDNRADIYSLGVVFYEMLTGELPGKTLEARPPISRTMATSMAVTILTPPPIMPPTPASWPAM